MYGAAQRFHLSFYKIKSHALAPNMLVKSLIQTKNFIAVFLKVNTNAIILKFNHNFIFFLKGFDMDMKISRIILVFNGVADEIIKNAFQVWFIGM